MATAKAQSEKEKGNAAFKAGDYANAIGHYTAAIIADGKDHTFPLNRAAAYLKLGKYVSPDLRPGDQMLILFFRNEDAERDCTAALSLSALNAKALFRRGQARLGMEKLDEALSDLTQALKREPANEAVKAEIKKVNDLLEKRKAKVRGFPLSVGEVFPTTVKAAKQKAEFSTSIPSPNRRRVPITIVEPSSPAPPAKVQPRATQTRSTPIATNEAASSSIIDTLQPVSTRSLKPTQSPPAATSPPAASTTPLNPSSAVQSTAPAPPKPEQPRSFKDAKQARETVKPSRVGGGIFRASGESTVFPTRISPTTTPENSMTLSTNGIEQLNPVSPAKAPTTCFEFSRAWEAAGTLEERWGIALSTRPGSLPALFKTSLEPSLLASILGVFQTVLATGDRSAGASVREYMDAFAHVERFETVVLFLSRAEKSVAKGVWESLGVGKEEAGRVWAKVWV
ncbi:hypothetical protein H0H81_011617 [Sphagnurus paluster]|uniref:RNA polymerase II-associated protein 3 n=1 Tax=Sphagnurus paluster TaxID=117069 RepID=A0A9P7GN23_9AGAR|nr:hypothetical protein H0H81_011617 [Sphagnurus paluster]